MPPTPSFDLTGKTALITGGSRGIGYAIAEAFVEHGATIAIAARTAEEVEASAKALSLPDRPAHGIVADLLTSAGVQGLVADTTDRLGTLDILVNNAGSSGRGKLAIDVDDELFDDLMAVNLRTPFLLCREFGRRWIDAGTQGRVINVTSLAGTKAYPNGVIYSASKGGLELMTKSLAIEWSKHGILVNSIAPGWVTTVLTSRIVGQPYEEYMLNRSPLGRWGKPEEISGIALFLASPAGSFTTGSTFVVDGGYGQG